MSYGDQKPRVTLSLLLSSLISNHGTKMTEITGIYCTNNRCIYNAHDHHQFRCAVC